MKKKLLSLMMTFVLAFTVFGCGSTSAVVGEQAAVRDFDPMDDTIYFAEQMVPLSDSVNSAQLKAMATAALDQVNASRAAAGLSTLKWSNGLEMAAMIRATELKASFSHTRPDGSEWWTVNGNLCYGENLARGFDSADGAVTGWRNSATHNANLMDAGFKSCAIAIFEENGQYYWAQEFGY